MVAHAHPYYFSFSKRVFDLSLAIILCTLLLPTIAVIGLVVLISSGWPVFFVQQRAGQNKKPFNIYKFRTMNNGAESLQNKLMGQNQAVGPMFKIHNDPRFTKYGRFLSRSGLDELPQLLNILKGEMSFVGPRPLPIKEARSLPKNWSFRHQVKPGLISSWTLEPSRHDSLKKWRELEEKTLKKGGVFYDTTLILKVVFKQLPNLVHN